MTAIDPNMLFFSLIWFAALIFIFGGLYRWLWAGHDLDQRKQAQREQADREATEHTRKLQTLQTSFEYANYYGVNPKEVFGLLSGQQPQIPMMNQGYQYPDQYQYPPQQAQTTCRELVRK